MSILTRPTEKFLLNRYKSLKNKEKIRQKMAEVRLLVVNGEDTATNEELRLFGLYLNLFNYGLVECVLHRDDKHEAVVCRQGTTGWWEALVQHWEKIEPPQRTLLRSARTALTSSPMSYNKIGLGDGYLLWRPSQEPMEPQVEEATFILVDEDKEEEEAVTMKERHLPVNQLAPLDLSPYFEPYLELDKALRDLGEKDPNTLLISFPRGRDLDGIIEIKYDELTAYCPWTSFPDQGSVLITYRPRNALLELKSLKYYFIAFRDKHITQEHLAQKMLEDLNALLDPHSLEVELDYMPRGGLHTVYRLNMQNT